MGDGRELGAVGEEFERMRLSKQSSIKPAITSISWLHSIISQSLRSHVTKRSILHG
jgi:hypothetical protein